MKNSKEKRARNFRNCACVECGKARHIPGKLCESCRKKARNGKFSYETNKI